MAGEVVGGGKTDHAMKQFDAAHAWDLGYLYATAGMNRHIPSGTWIVELGKDFLGGYEAACQDGKWGTCRRQWR